LAEKVDRLRQGVLRRAGDGPVLAYLGRYIHQIALSNHRITFTHKGPNYNNRTKPLVLPAMEFIHSFLIHALPKRFMKIRYYGFLTNVGKKKAVLLIRRLIGKYMEVVSYGMESIRKKMLRLTGQNILCCPQCGKGTMQFMNLLYSDSG
jgi:hypothetical protein